MRLLSADLGSGFAMCSGSLLSANFGSERLRDDTRPSLRSNRRSPQRSYQGYTALRTSSMARTARATKARDPGQPRRQISNQEQSLDIETGPRRTPFKKDLHRCAEGLLRQREGIAKAKPGVKRTWRGLVSMSANDPKRTQGRLRLN